MESEQHPVVDRREMQAAIEARKELGAELEPQLVDSFVERIEKRLGDRTRAVGKRQEGREGSFVLALVSVVMAIPITAIAAVHGGIAALIIVWAGIVLVNAVYGRR